MHFVCIFLLGFRAFACLVVYRGVRSAGASLRACVHACMVCALSSERMSGVAVRRKKGAGLSCCMVFSPARISHAFVNVSVALSNQVAFCSKTDKKRSLTSRRFRSSSSSSSLSIPSSVFFICLLIYKVIMEFRALLRLLRMSDQSTSEVIYYFAIFPSSILRILDLFLFFCSSSSLFSTKCVRLAIAQSCWSAKYKWRTHNKLLMLSRRHILPTQCCKIQQP